MSGSVSLISQNTASLQTPFQDLKAIPLHHLITKFHNASSGCDEASPKIKDLIDKIRELECAHLNQLVDCAELVIQGKLSDKNEGKAIYQLQKISLNTQQTLKPLEEVKAQLQIIQNELKVKTLQQQELTESITKLGSQINKAEGSKKTELNKKKRGLERQKQPLNAEIDCLHKKQAELESQITSLNQRVQLSEKAFKDTSCNLKKGLEKKDLFLKPIIEAKGKIYTSMEKNFKELENLLPKDDPRRPFLHDVQSKLATLPKH